MLAFRFTFFGLILSCGLSFAAEKDAFEYNRLLGRGVNLGNALDAPKEGEWGIVIQPGWFKQIKQAGFDSVRIPIRWSAHAAKEAPYKIDETFFKRVDELVELALEQKLAVVINMHHYEEIFKQPEEHKERWLALWDQICRRYAKHSDQVFFELLNEPHEKLTPKLWNDFLVDAIPLVRRTNPDRMLIIGPGFWNNYAELKNLKLPKDDRRIIVTFHYYLPFEFTHQGASWSEGSDKWVGRKWPQGAEEQEEIVSHFNSAAEWAKTENRPLYVGEFGAYEKADMESRARWTAFVRQQAEKRGMSWAYWELASGFGVLDPQTGEWRKPLLSALIPESRE